jgi:hypothetical protein
MIDFVDTQVARPGGLAICEGIETRSEDHTLADAALYRLSHALFGIAASQNHMGTQSSSRRFLNARWVRLNSLEHIRVKQARGYRIVENLGFAVQKLVNGPEGGGANRGAAGVTFWRGVVHG